MRLKQLFICLTMLVCLSAKAQTDTYFQYPLIPDSINTLQGRSDYLAHHFWDFCDLSKAFSAKAKMAKEFKVYLDVLTHATADSALISVGRLTKALEKQPKDLLFLAQEAEAHLYADSAEKWCDEIYLPFAQAVAANKRIDKASKARFALHANVLAASMAGGPIADLPYTTRSGEARSLKMDSAQVVVVYFFDPDCSECGLARIRLDADVSMTELIADGIVKVVAISLNEPDADWKAHVEGFPATWTVGAAPDADLQVDLRVGTPDFYILDRRHNIFAKHLVIDQVLDVARQLKKR